MVRVNVPVCELRFVLTVSVDEAGSGDGCRAEAGWCGAAVAGDAEADTAGETTGVIVTVLHTGVTCDRGADGDGNGESALIAPTTNVTLQCIQSAAVAVMVSG
jgi:hypothetical protein